VRYTLANSRNAKLFTLLTRPKKSYKHSITGACSVNYRHSLYFDLCAEGSTSNCQVATLLWLLCHLVLWHRSGNIVFMSAERQRRHIARIAADPQKRAEFLLKDRLRKKKKAQRETLPQHEPRYVMMQHEPRKGSKRCVAILPSAHCSSFLTYWLWENYPIWISACEDQEKWCCVSCRVAARVCSQVKVSTSTYLKASHTLTM